MNNENNTLKWRFDVSTFRLIGRDLITDRVTALFELIKNCYDANATVVTVEFDKVGTLNDDSIISISDNGIGMSFEDVRDKWMVIGTSSKRRNPLSPAPICRRCVGEKGIGRFAVDKLGDQLNILTKQIGDSSWLNVYIDWREYFNQLNDDTTGIRLFTEIENSYNYIPSREYQTSGTTLKISQARDVWTKNDILRLLRESSRIVSPFEKTKFPFRIHVIAPEYNINAWSDEYKIDGRDLATVSASITFYEDKQQCLLFNEKTGNIDINETDIKSFGGVSMELYYFDAKARDAYRRKFPGAKIDGIKIYRDGVITTPFAEQEDASDKKRDILGIDKRLWVSLFDKISTRELIGIVNISKDGNPNIIDATNRQDFTSTPEYIELKAFIILQLEALEQYKKYIGNKKKSDQTKKIENAGTDILQISKKVEDLTKDNPSLSEILVPLKDIAMQAWHGIETAAKNQHDIEEEHTRHENMYLRIMESPRRRHQCCSCSKDCYGKNSTYGKIFSTTFPK